MSEHGPTFDAAQRARDYSESPDYWFGEDEDDIGCELCIWNRFGSCRNPGVDLKPESPYCPGFQD